MQFSKELRLKIFIGIDVIFFLIEIVIGYWANSLALVADAFHMLNDVLSLCVGLWAVKVATTKPSDNQYTYGFARAELLGGLVNGVFLIALCLSIFLEALNRLFDPPEVTNPGLVGIVGAIGLAFNILGLFVFHQHGHGHSHGDDHDHEHSETFAEDELGTAEEGHAGHAHGTLADMDKSNSEPAGMSKFPPLESATKGGRRGQSVSWGDGADTLETSPLVGPRRSSVNSRRGSRQVRSGSRSYGGIDALPIHPASLRNEFISRARRGDSESEDDELLESESNEDEGTSSGDLPSEVLPLLSKGTSNGASLSKKTHSNSKQDARSFSTQITHSKHRHAQPRPEAKGGHSHSDMNIRGIFLHVLGDALGNIGVIAAALVIRQTDWKYRFHFDPIISFLITGIILYSAIPLCRDTAKPLLQAVPSHISIEDIREDIESLPGVQSCHHLHVWALTPSKLIATLDVELNFDFEGKGAQRYMKLAREIKKCLHEHGIHNSTIQPEFYTAVSPLDSRSTGLETKFDGSNHQDGGLDGTNGKRRAQACLLDCDDGGDSSKACCSTPGSGTTTPKGTDSENSGHRTHK